MKSFVIMTITFMVLFLVFSALALHLEAFITNGYHVTDGQFAFPTVFFPTSAHHSRGSSIPLIVAAAAAGALYPVLFRRFLVERWHWVTEAEYARLFKRK